MKRTPSITGARTLEAEVHAMGERARAAAVVLREASTESKNNALLAASKAIRVDKDKILAANDDDMRAAETHGL